MSKQTNISIGTFNVDVKKLAAHETPEYIAQRFQEELQRTLFKIAQTNNTTNALFANKSQLGTSTETRSAPFSFNRESSSPVAKGNVTKSSSGSVKALPALSGANNSSIDQRKSESTITVPTLSGTSTSNDNVNQITNNANTGVSNQELIQAIENKYLDSTSIEYNEANNTDTGVSNQELIQAIENKYLDSTSIEYNEAKVGYWKDLVMQLQARKPPTNFLNKKGYELFTNLHENLESAVLLKTDLSIDWNSTRNKMIAAIESNLLYQSNEDSFWEYILRKLKNPNVDIYDLFTTHNELFLILQNVLNVDQLPSAIYVYAGPKIYPKISTKNNVYANIGTNAVYKKLRDLKFIELDGGILKEVIISDLGEKTQNQDGTYPALLETQWYKKHRVKNAIDPNSTFWKACVVNTEYGRADLYKTIEQRHAYYKFADAYLKSKGIISEWFGAAAHVTMNDPFKGEITLGGADEWTIANMFFISDSTQDFLQGGNKFLFEHNMNNVQLLLEGKGTIDLEFLDANGQKQSFKGLTKKQLDFKLVEFEQTLVQKYIIEYAKKIKSDDVVSQMLEKYNLKNTPEESIEEIIEEINGLFAGKGSLKGVIKLSGLEFASEDIIKKFFTISGKVTFDFKDYKKRVALGSAMVEELYYHRYRDTLADKFKKISIAPKDFIEENPVESVEHMKLIYGKYGIRSGYDIESAVKKLRENVKPKPIGKCGRYVRYALEAGNGLKRDGLLGITPSAAKDFDTYLTKKKFYLLEDVSNLENYKPVKGDIAVFVAFQGAKKFHQYGHVQMYDGEKWISDFSQRGFWAGGDYRKFKPSFKIYRW